MRSAIMYIAVAAMIISVMVLAASAADTDNPRIIMSGYTIDDESSDMVSVGTFTLNYTLVNPSAVGVVNAVISYEQKNAFIMPAPGSANIENIGNIPAGREYNGSLILYIPKTAEAGICRIDFTVSYSSGDPTVRSLLTSTFSIYINIENNAELTLKKVDLSDEAATGGRKRLLIEYDNPGSRDFKNLQLVIDGNITEQQKIQILPILKAGKSNSIDYYVQFTETGEQSISVHISYEDDAGNSYKTPLMTKTVTVAVGSAVQPSNPGTENEGYISELIKKMKAFAKTPEFAVILVVCFLAAVAVVVIVSQMRKRAKKKTWYYKNSNEKNSG